MSRVTGSTSAGHPEWAAGNYFSTFSRLRAKFSTYCRYNVLGVVKQDCTTTLIRGSKEKAVLNLRGQLD